MTASPHARTRPGGPLLWVPLGRSRLSTAMRLNAVVVVLQLFVVLVVSAIVMARTGGTVWFWGWAVLWTIVLLASGGAQLRRNTGQAMRAPVLAGSATVIMGFVVQSFDVTLGPVSLGDGRTMLAGILALTLLVLLVRIAVDASFPPRTLVLAPAESDVPRAQLRGEQYLVLAPDILDDRDALVAAVAMAVDDHDAERVEITTELNTDTVRHLSWELRDRGIGVSLPLEAPGARRSRLHTENVLGASALIVGPPTQNVVVHGAKRFFDIVGATGILIAVSPLMLAVVVAMKVNMPGPIFYRQQRVGKDGRPFEIIKFRSMEVDADSQLQSLLAQQASDDSPLFKVDRDPRITRLGAVMRRYSIDELPQLFNVLNGSMSLVGPRPQREAEVALYTGNASHRLGVLPGMTGLWQVSGRSDLSWEAAQELDVYYAHNWSLGFDLVILFRTFRAVFTAAGAR